jgi:hypothetical protein
MAIRLDDISALERLQGCVPRAQLIERQIDSFDRESFASLQGYTE